ncbi:alpha/beta hydrolase [Brachybacterium sp. SGAir0954]|uniref:alpha/beta fold hydrolase n=1 Tax=Brachybacterium sp. SGAir0954 TaxID=2571029 RepID=UPI0010CD0110|nr:alpha/beta hydrolase [Brachybacterium sp. SGAir0954]QCR54279.1 alpha/beta hydrolase [Brachybacterium sp. SGAir0954]
MTRSIVLIHAVRSSRTMWKGQTRRLRERGYTVIAPDLPGHGRRRGEPFTLEAALATIDEAVAACEEPPLLVGLSLGGFLTLHWAGTHPGRLAGVVAADCTIVPGPALARLYGLWITMKDWLPGDSDARVARAFARRHSDKAARRYYGGGRAHGVVRTVVRTIGSLELLTDVAAIDIPVTFVNGEHDPFRRHEALFVEAARDGRLVILDDAGHIANLSRPKRFAKVLRRAAAAGAESRLAREG